jgi:DNA-binding MarR family transcriptional regulator
MAGMPSSDVVPADAAACSGLDADLGWTLGVVFRAYARTARSVLADLPGGPRGYQVLAAAARDEPGSQSALAQRLGIDRTVMTYLLDDLVGAGLVERRADPVDRRSRLVAATDKGTAALDALDQRLGQAEDQLLVGLADDDRAQLRSLLQRLATQINGRDPDTDACAEIPGDC